MEKDKAGKSSDFVTHEQAEMLAKRLEELGYDSVRDMAIRTGLIQEDGKPNKLALWTVNRAFKAGAEQVGFRALAWIMLALDFDRRFIRDHLRAMGDDFAPALIGYGMADLSPAEEAMINAARKIGPTAIPMLANQLELIAQTAGADVANEMKMVRTLTVSRPTASG